VATPLNSVKCCVQATEYDSVFLVEVDVEDGVDHECESSHEC